MAQRSSYQASLLAVPQTAPAAVGPPTAARPAAPVESRKPTLSFPPKSASALPDRFDAAFLTSDALDAYVAYAGGDAFDPRFSVFSKIPDFSPGHAAPLALCEFLGYKSVLAYESESAMRAHFAAGQWRGIDQAHFKFFDSSVAPTSAGDTQGFGFTSGDTAFIIMRGSTSFSDWRANLDGTLTTNAGIAADQLAKIGGAAPARHYGFALCWANIVLQIEDWVKSLPVNVKQFCFSGHSQGGALAIIGAHDFARRNIGPVGAVVTFAAPKLGGAEFVKDYNTYGLHDRTLRCESPEDAVTWLALHSDFEAPGAQCLVEKRPMIAGWEKLWAGLLGIAGWRPTDAKPAFEAAKPASDQANAPAGGGAKDNGAAPAKSGDAQDKGATKIDAQTALAYFIVAVALFVAYLLARKLVIRYRAHGAAKRYALYFTTIAYGKIRAIRIPDPKTATAADFARASADLDAHLRYIRGDAVTVASFAKLKKFPIRVRDAAMYEMLMADTKAEKDEAGPRGGYPQYFW